MPKESINIKENINSGIKEPNQYSVIFHNDDFTPMDFVTLILIQFFYKSEPEAFSLMLKVHQEGKATVGTYSYDIAASKANAAINLARKNSYPLRITVNKI